MNPRRASFPGVRLGVLWLAALLAATCGCVKIYHPAPGPFEQAFDQVCVAEFGTADPSKRTSAPLPESAYVPVWPLFNVPWLKWVTHWFHIRPLRPLKKIHPRLEQWIATRPGTDHEKLMIAFVDTVRIPRFPRPDLALSPKDSVNVRADSIAATLIEAVKRRRRAQYQADTAGFGRDFQADRLSTYWVVQAVLVDMPLGKVTALAARPGVVYIRPNVGERAPDCCQGVTNPNAVIEETPFCAQKMIGTLAYTAMGLAGGRIALLDTGVETTHGMLCNTGKFCLVVNCLTPGVDCSALDGSTPCTAPATGCKVAPGVDVSVDGGHGTCSANILIGDRGVAGLEDFGGMTDAPLDAYTVYDDTEYENSDAVQKAFEGVIHRGSSVAVVEVAETGPEYDAIATSANNAYDGGVMVFGAEGNSRVDQNGQPIPVCPPAIGRKVIGVGEFDVHAPHALGTTGPTGPTDDHRLKPDLVAPSGSRAAGQGGGFKGFGGSSGATPYAAGAAWLMRSWMELCTAQVDPGQVYAQMILAGDQVGPFSGDSNRGAGYLQLPVAGTGMWGKVYLSPGVDHVDIPIPVASGVGRIEAAIWWPEERPWPPDDPASLHNDVNLSLALPGVINFLWWKKYNVVATSAGPDGVFERLAWDPPATGTYHLLISPKTMKNPGQVVYWSVSLQDKARSMPDCR